MTFSVLDPDVARVSSNGRDHGSEARKDSRQGGCQTAKRSVKGHKNDRNRKREEVTAVGNTLLE